jgi:hypothetical protein
MHIVYGALGNEKKAQPVAERWKVGEQRKRAGFAFV